MQQVRVGGGVLEVARVCVAEDLDGALGEVRALVDVVDVRQPVVVVRDAQEEAHDHDQPEHGECRALGAQASNHGADGSFDPTFAMKLIIQVPCLNGEESLPVTLRDLPRTLAGFDTVELLVVDDGSTDRTIDVAREHGVHHIVRLTNNKGLASGFQAGLDACLKLGADVIVNTDADNQYDGRDVEKLVAPILAGGADMVVGDRQVMTSGFRAYNREAALGLQVVSKFTYTLETIIQAGKMTVAIDHVPVRTNPKMRESRLFPSMWTYIRRNGVSIFRIYALYEPLRVFMTAALVVGLIALAVWARFFYFWIDGDGGGHVQSLILGAVLFNAAMVLAALGVLGDLISGQRITLQRIFERVRRVELELGVPPSHYEPGSPESGREPTTGAHAGGRGKTEEREAVKL